MAKITIAVIDYGMGNLRSVAKALECAGANAVVADAPSRIRTADAVVFPGVGSFGPALTNLKAARLIDPLKEAIAGRTPFLGLCLGFQLLFDLSREGGVHRGLGIIDGDVARFDFGPKTAKLKVPHMGWNQVKIGRSGAAMFNGIADRSYFYFVHSYYGRPADRRVVAGSTEYGIRFCAAVARDAVWGCQFHPEKSGANGLKLLKNFIREAGKR